jgi:hypothetical protein
MLSKDHFSNVLNEPAGKIASQILKWVVPQIIAAWDDERVDIKRTNDRIIHGIFHHPALRDQGQDGASDGRRLIFGVVEKWWREKNAREQDELRRQLSREGVENGQNHKPGVVDHGHGCGKPLGMPTFGTAQSSGAVGGGAAMSLLGGLSEIAGGGNNTGSYGGGNGISQIAGEAAGGNILGGIVGGLAGAVGGDLLGGAFNDKNTQSFSRQSYDEDGRYQQTVTQVGGQGGRFEQAQYSRTDEPNGGYREEYQRFGQGSNGRTGYGVQEITETQPTYGGGYEQNTDVRRLERMGDGEYRNETKRYSSRGEGYEYGRNGQYSRDDEETEGYDRSGGRQPREEEPSFQSAGYGRPERDEGYGRRQEDGYRQEESFGRQEAYGQEQSGGLQEQRRSREYGQPAEYEGGFQEQRRSREYGQEQEGYGGGREQAETFGEERSGKGSFLGDGEQEERRADEGRRENENQGYGNQGYGEGGEDEERY